MEEERGKEGERTGLLSILPNFSFSRHSSDSGYQSKRASRPSSVPVSRTGSKTESWSKAESWSRSEGRAESTSSLYSSDCPEEEVVATVRVVPGGDVTEVYQLGTLLGDGAFSKVYLAESLEEPGGLAAVKVIDKRELCREGDKMFLVDKEIEIMSQLDHAHIVRLYEVYENETEVCLVMELAKGGELFDRLLEVGSLGEREAGRLMAQVLSAVSHLHSLGIVHRDLKPENLLYYDNRSGSPLLVADFGLSEYEEVLSPASPVCGTATYLAPEVISGSSSTRHQDLWSCGVIAYILLAGYPPFCKEPGGDEDSLLRQIVQGRLHFHHQFWHSVSEPAQDFVRRLLVADPCLRMDAQEALAHPWIREMTRKEAGLTLPATLATTLLVTLALATLILLHLFLLTDYFDLEAEMVERVVGAATSLSTFLSRHSEIPLLLQSFFLDLR